MYQLLNGSHVNNSTNSTSPKEIFDKWWNQLESFPDMTAFDMDQQVRTFLGSFDAELDKYLLYGWHDTERRELDFSEFKGSWEYVSYLIRIILSSINNDYNWNTDQIGTLFIKGLNTLIYNGLDCLNLHRDLYDLIEETFTMPGDEVSLPDIVQLFTIMDFKELIMDSTITEKSNPMKPISMKPAFTSCFDHIVKTKDLNHESDEEFFDDASRMDFQFLEQSPCNEPNMHPKCEDYCTWHKKFMNKTMKRDLIQIVKYGMPQRKFVLENSPLEFNQAKKLFPDQKLLDSANKVASMSTAVFCHEKENGYDGDDIGLYAKVCNKFFLTPSDVGLVHTKNFDIKAILKENPDYGSLFEPEKQTSSSFIHGGTMWSETTLVIDTDHSTMLSQTYPRKTGITTDTIQLQIHQAKEFANMILDSENDNPIKMKAGNEYFVDVTPIGQISDNDFKALSFTQRRCRLDHEIDESGIFQSYSSLNCKYECQVKLAINACGCVPWDYLHNENAEECDVFGRTCFMNKMVQIKQSPEEVCGNCDKECDFFKFQKKITEIKELSTSPYGGKYFKRVSNFQGRVNKGNKAFLSFLENTNGTIIDKGLQKAYTYMAQNFDETYPLDKYYQDLIVVHLRFKKPDVIFVSPKYSLFDMIGNFGGQLGLFEQITGASFLGMINLLILLAKLVFPSHK